MKPRVRSWRGGSLVTSLLLAFLSGCAQTTAAGTKEPRGQDAAKVVQAFETTEDAVLRDLSSLDPRLAQRTRITPHEDDLRRVAMSAVLAEDPNLAVVDGRIDPFSFEARQRGLAKTHEVFLAGPSRLPAAAEGTLPRPALERELLGRLIDEELVRLDDERKLPRSASALLRGVIETWTAPRSPAEAAERDRWLARRLDEVRASVEGGSLDLVRARELDDTLDALEHDVDQPGLGQAIAKLVELRQAIEASSGKRATPPPEANGSGLSATTSRKLQVHLGLTPEQATAERLEESLARAEKTLLARAREALELANLPDSAISEKIAKLVFSPAPCVDAIVGSRVRSMAPPPERLAVCQLRHLLDKADDDASMALALTAMHEHVVISMWALEVLRGSTLEEAEKNHRPMSLPAPETTAHWERIALARPVSALGGGLAAGVLIARGDAKADARAWARLGEVPLDIAVRELDANRLGSPRHASPKQGENAARD